MDFSSHISPFTMTSEANGLPPVMARMSMKVSSGIATRTALPALSSSCSLSRYGNPHVIHKQGDVLEKRIRQHGRAVHRGSLLQVRAARRHKVFFREYGLPEQCTPACTRAL